MVPPELMKRNPFFSVFDERELRALATLAHDESALEGTVLFREKEPATALYFLLDGEIDLYTTVSETNPRHLFAGEINPGDPFGVSAILEPYVYRTSARAPMLSRFLKLDAKPLHALMERDCALALKLVKQIARATVERVEVLRLQIAAMSRHRDDGEED